MLSFDKVLFVVSVKIFYREKSTEKLKVSLGKSRNVTFHLQKLQLSFNQVPGNAALE